LLFGIATSVEMLQARLPKVTTRQLQGRQFDVVQQGTILDSIVKSAVAAPELKIRIGPSLFKTFVERLQNQMAGIQSFVSSLKASSLYRPPLTKILLI
jgi:origin recognition complex subunit 3